MRGGGGKNPDNKGNKEHKEHLNGNGCSTATAPDLFLRRESNWIKEKTDIRSRRKSKGMINHQI